MPPKKQARLLDFDIPFFLPVWRRVLVVIVPVLWAIFEFSTGALAWGLIFLGLGGIAGWKLYIADWDAVRAAAEAEDKE
ncbi:hypothetical protein [Ruegeria sp. HKCCA6707]|uniref:hypothetical protein n=1 Tax=unclassified Ruegeria TaxID=2625375 RepID=UPI001488196E|nr:hypothetical protein [Ruegeria sp. HKCCA6707]